MDYQRWCIGAEEAGSDEYRLIHGRAHGTSIVAQLEGIDDRDVAESLKSQTIWVKRTELPECEPGQYYWADLEGLTVESLDGRCFGTVDYLIATGSNDVLVVRGEKEVLIPFLVGDVVREVDPERGRILVDWDEEYL